MSGMWDTVIVILVPGGPESGDIVTYGLPSVLRSVVAHARLHNGMAPSPINRINVFFNYETARTKLIRLRCNLLVRMLVLN